MDYDMDRSEWITDANADPGVCRGCGNPLEITEDEIHNGPRDEVNLTCTILGTQDCVAGEWFKIQDLI